VSKKPKAETKYNMMAVPSDVYAELKAYATEKGIYIRKVLELSIRAYLKAEKAKEAANANS
jgi:predicted naringenin-chalcone synthase